ncbi:hypothetical protein [Nocardia pseudobrasiliensis]|uniref:Ig-like domain-containing protein n=1 Tax=Nocardia pseudobrasiliensis TaxID=45979 RepID=A0A370I9X3_9NOCA|nr:hypothetical protein [Nocardia pseudobrasiliensis]RDI67512.1 hypothetical protein DFR76_103583 [Nocardia pseudobrasiliensis]
MSRRRSTRLSVALIGSVGVVFAVGAATASASPSAALHGGATIAAHVTGERSGQVCRIAATGIEMPWRPVGSDGSVDLDTGPVRAGRHTARVVCEDPGIGDASQHSVGRAEEVFTGHWAPAFEFLHHHRLEVLTPRG